MENLYIALLLPLIAGLSTTIGSFIAFFLKKPSKQFISIIMGFSAGVMILISFIELLPTGIETNGLLMGITFFFIGMIIMLIIDVTITHQYGFEDSMEILTNSNGSCEYGYQTPKQHRHPLIKMKNNRSRNSGNPNQLLVEIAIPEESSTYKAHGKSRQGYRHRHQKRVENEREMLEKTSILVFIGIFIHNLPEGMATFVGAVKDFQLGFLLMLAIALHNIPEGIAVSVPIYICTGNRKKAFLWSFLSGISEFIGAVIVALVLYSFINDAILGIMLSIVAGIMIYISLDELLPVAHSFGEEHSAIIGLMIGMFVMALSIVLI